MENKRPSYQWYPKDLLSDNEAMSMSNEAHGIYRKLLDFDWINDGIPSDRPTLMRMVGFDWHTHAYALRETEDVDGVWASVYSKFIAHPSKEGFSTNPRLLKEKKKQDDYKKEKKKAGRMGAEKRWGKPNKRAIAKDSTPIVLPMAKNASSSATSSSSKERNIDHFETFWNQYPRKVGRKKAEQIFKRLPPLIHEKIITALETQKEQKQWRESKYIPHPATWLSQGRWDDVIEEQGWEDRRDGESAAQWQKRLLFNQ